MTDPACYQAYGLTISADLPLALPPGPRAARAAPDIVLRRGAAEELSGETLDRDDPATVASYDTPTGRWYLAVRTRDGYRLRFRDAGEFILSEDLAQVRWIPQADGRPEIMPVLFAGTVLAFALTLRGHLVLHASAVADGGRVLAFVGQSGRGKSTLAALMAAEGARVVTDDLLLVDVAGAEGVRCRGHGGELRLRSSAQPLATAFGGRAQSRTTADGRLSLLARDVESAWADLGAVVVPSPTRQASALEIHRLPASTALLWLLRFPRVHGLRPADVLQRQFELLGELARRVPVFEVVVPWGPPFPPELATELRRVLDLQEAHGAG